ncbi:MAG TPA: LysR substrate-binding domain-containing protein [Kofleriaceae bacterium]|jgi:DNA-binding transcriptional LysR family regulator|nr:LysR substrate-binding domain-containing protein [Kofleriaceae bacterium]
MIELRLLRYFIAVAETEHVGKAATRLHISQSPLSRQIRQLEDLIGVPLFDRERRRIRITPAGRWLLGHARELVARGDALVRDVRAISGGDAGQIAVGCVGTALASGILPRVLRRLRSERPGVRLVLRQAASSAQLAQLRAGELDLALIHGDPRAPDLAVRRVFEQPYVLAVPRSGPLARRAIRPAQLEGQPWILVAPGDDERDRWATAWGAAGFTPEVTVRVVEWTSALALVDAGIGLALVPRSYAAMPPRHVAIRELPWLKLTSRLSLAVRRSAGSKLTGDVAHWIEEAAAQIGSPR